MNQQILDIFQEEAAECIQAVSKVKRFGIDNTYNGVCNRDHLEEEIGDMIAMIELIAEGDMINMSNVYKYALAKKDKLRKWSTIKV